MTWKNPLSVLHVQPSYWKKDRPKSRKRNITKNSASSGQKLLIYLEAVGLAVVNLRRRSLTRRGRSMMELIASGVRSPRPTWCLFWMNRPAYLLGELIKWRFFVPTFEENEIFMFGVVFIQLFFGDRHDSLNTTFLCPIEDIDSLKSNLKSYFTSDLGVWKFSIWSCTGYYYDRVVPRKSNYDRQVPHAFRML